MRPQNVFHNTGVIIANDSGRFLGSCFAFRYPSYFLTADHCVPPELEHSCSVELPAVPGKRFPIGEVRRHGRADVAVLLVPTVSEDDLTWLQYLIVDDHGWGQPFAACGYPEEYRADRPEPTARIFHGTIQRFFQHRSHLGYEYAAAELSTGAPRGLSGAPVFNPGFHGRLYGVVAENVRTVTDVETVSEVQEGGNTRSELYHNVINYGVAVWLPLIADWLDAQVPPVPEEELARRGNNQEIWRQAQSQQ